MKFNCEYSHPYKLFIEYINSTEEADLIFDYIDSIDAIQFGNMSHGSSGSLMIIDDDLRRLAEILNETDFVSVLTNRYLDSMKSSISNSKNHDIEITLRFGEFRERMIEHWSNLSIDELQTIQRAFRDQHAHKDEYSEYFNLRIMENNLNKTDFSINRTKSLTRMCEVHFGENNTVSSDSIENPVSINEFQQRILPEIEKIKTPTDNMNSLCLMKIPNLRKDKLTKNSIMDEFCRCSWSFNQDIDSDQILYETDIEKTYQTHKQELDSLKVFSDLISRNDYLKLDETYRQLLNDRKQKLDSFNKQRKRTYDAFHPTSQENWIQTADFTKQNNHKIGHSNGVITICYWQLYYSNNKLFKDLKSLDSDKPVDLLQYLDIISRYYRFIKDDLLRDVVDSITNKHESIRLQLLMEHEQAERDLINVKNNSSTSGKTKSEAFIYKKFMNNSELSNKLKKSCKNIIMTHFNLELVEQILEIYCHVISQHKFLLKRYQDEQKVVQFF